MHRGTAMICLPCISRARCLHKTVVYLPCPQKKPSAFPLQQATAWLGWKVLNSPMAPLNWISAAKMFFSKVLSGWLFTEFQRTASKLFISDHLIFSLPTVCAEYIWYNTYPIRISPETGYAAN